MTVGEIIEQQKKWKVFTSTEIGRLFDRYEKLRDEAWHQDARVEYTDVGMKSSKEAWKRSDEAREALLVELKKIAQEELDRRERMEERWS